MPTTIKYLRSPTLPKTPIGGVDEAAMSIKANLPWIENAVPITLNTGRMTTGLTVYGTSGRYASISVQGGQKYLVSGGCGSNLLPCAFCTDANNTVTKLLATVGTTYTKEEITIPSGCTTLYVNAQDSEAIGIWSVTERLTQSQFAGRIGKIAELESDESALESTKADLPYNLTPIEITIENGVIRNDLTVSTAETEKHAAISVTAGQVYCVNCESAARTYSAAFCTDDNDNVTVLLASQQTFRNEIITIPSGCTTLYINGRESGLAMSVSLAERATQKDFRNQYTVSRGKKPNLKVQYKDGTLYVKKKYDSEKDLMLTFFNSTTGNYLWTFAGARYIGNTGAEPNDEFVGYLNLPTWGMSHTNWFGGYVIEAKNNIDGDTPNNKIVTGAFHRTTNETTGGGVTASQLAFSLLINGIGEMQENTIYTCESLVMRWTNGINAYNTSKADGSGRNVMTETLEVVIDSDFLLKVRNKMTALESIAVSHYYGLCMTSPPSNTYYYYLGGANRGRYTALSGENARNSGNNTCRKAVLGSDYFKCEVGVEPVDLGLFEYNDGTSIFPSNGKFYTNVLSGNNSIDLAEGDSLWFEGYYHFY